MKPAHFDEDQPEDELRQIPIIECGEPSVDFLAYCPSVGRIEPEFVYRLETWLRRGLAKFETHPALHMTPEAYNQQPRSAAEHTRQRDEQHLRKAVNEVERVTKAVNRMLEVR